MKENRDNIVPSTIEKQNPRFPLIKEKGGGGGIIVTKEVCGELCVSTSKNRLSFPMLQTRG